MQWSSPRASMGLSILPASVEPSLRPAPTMLWTSSINRMICPSLALISLEHGLEALFEFAAVLGAGHQGPQIQGEYGPSLQPLGNVSTNDALGQPFNYGGLANPGLTDKDRIVLGFFATRFE